jgi:uncharacterized membrane protein YoaK (UPF0700 family)
MLNSKRNVALACALSGLAGFVDAIGFIYLGGLFVSFMSGNSTRLGVSLAEAKWDSAGEAAGIIALFVFGAAAGSLIVTTLRSHRQASVLAVEGLLLALAAVLADRSHSYITIALIIVAMGLENAIFQSGNTGGIGLTYITGALVKVGQALATALQGGARWGWLPNFLLWAALVVGSVAGALAYEALKLDAIWIGAVVAFILSAILAIRAPDASAS